MTAASTAASLICNVTLLIDFFRTKNFSRHGSGASCPLSKITDAIRSH